MQRVKSDGTLIDYIPIDLEETFIGLRYRSCTGLEDRGEPKNIYTEKYPETDGSRVWHPSDAEGGKVKKDDTTIKLDLVFLGGADAWRARLSYEEFLQYASESRLYYWDTARLRKVQLLLKSSVSPKADMVKGERYLEAEFTFVNLWGESKPCNAEGVITNTTE